jgi:hypothetical protein
LDNDLTLAYENDKGGIEAGCFGANKHNPTIKKCLEYYTNRAFIKSDGSFDTLPLPQIMAKYCNNSDLDINDMFFFTCKSFETGIITTKPYTYTIHHFAGSWLSDGDCKRSKFRQKLIQKAGNSILTKFIYKTFNFVSETKEFGFRNTVQKYIDKIRKHI